MKTKLLILATLLLAVFTIALPSCDKDDPEPVTSQGLLGHWKLQGFWSGDTQISMEIAHLEKEYTYTLNFEDSPVPQGPDGPFLVEVPPHCTLRMGSGRI